MKRIFLSEEIRSQIRHLPPDLKKKIRNALDELLGIPSLGKELEEELQGYRSYKLGKIRIIYKINTPHITVIALGPRKTIYEKIILELKRANA